MTPMDQLFLKAYALFRDQKLYSDPESDLKTEIRHLFPNQSSNSIAEACKRVRELADTAYDVALASRANKLDQEPRQVLMKRCPGLPNSIYKTALADGMFDSR